MRQYICPLLLLARLKNRCLGCVLGPNIWTKTFIRRSIKQTQTRACKPLAMQPDKRQKLGWNYNTKLQTIFATENGCWLIFLQNILFTKYYLCNFKALLQRSPNLLSGSILNMTSRILRNNLNNHFFKKEYYKTCL